jgi:hypothetical protein
MGYARFVSSFKHIHLKECIVIKLRHSGWTSKTKLLAVSAAALLASHAGHAATNTPVTGLNIGPEINEILSKPNPAAAVDTYMAGIAATNVRWVRIGINWARTQPARTTIIATDPNPGTSSGLTWGNADLLIRSARNHGMRVLGLITLTPSWAVSSSCTSTALSNAGVPGSTWLCAPAAADYAAFAIAAAKHYSDDSKGGRVDQWEVWNEPNCGHEFLPHDPALYTQLLQQSYAGIKAANPAATVLAGGSASCATSGMSSPGTLPPGGINSLLAANPSMSWDTRDWLTAMYANGAQGYFDGLAHHPYCFSDDWQGGTNRCPTGTGSWSAFAQMWYPSFPSPSQGWPVTVNGVTTYPYQSYVGTSLRAIMDNNGDGAKSIVFTEFGAPTTGTDGNPNFTGTLGGTSYTNKDLRTVASSPNLTQANQYREYQEVMNWVAAQPWGKYGPVFSFSYADLALTSPSSVNVYEPYFGLVTIDGNTATTGIAGPSKLAYALWQSYGAAATSAANNYPIYSPQVGPGW